MGVVGYSTWIMALDETSGYELMNGHEKAQLSRPRHREVLLHYIVSFNLGEKLVSENVPCKQGIYVRGLITAE